jgi:hypothetical protein
VQVVDIDLAIYLNDGFSSSNGQHRAQSGHQGSLILFTKEAVRAS